MATLRFVGRAVPVAQVETVTVGGTVEATDVFSLTINEKTLDVVAGSTVVDTVAATIATAWNALSSTTYPEFAEITAAAIGSGGQLTLTHDTAGKPFTVTVATTESGGGAADLQTIGTSTTTAASGPNHWDSAANWDTGSVPVNSDIVYVDWADAEIKYGLAQSAVTLAELHVLAGQIGLPEFNTAATTYAEYRAKDLTIGATILNIETDGGLCNIDNSSVQVAVTVIETGDPIETNGIAFRWKGTNASNTFQALGGDVGIASRSGESATASLLETGAGGDGGGGPTLLARSGVTLTTVNVLDGAVELNSAATTLTIDGGQTVVKGSGAYTTIDVRGGQLNYRGTGTIATLTTNSPVDFSGEMGDLTVTNCELHAGAGINAPHRRVTWTNGMDLNECGIEDVTLNLGKNIRLVPSDL